MCVQMITIKIDKDRRGNMNLRLSVKKNTEEIEEPFLKRFLLEGRKSTSSKQYPIVIPLKYLGVLINNLSKDKLKIDKRSITTFFEFSDQYDECYYYSTEATPSYLKKWREVECPKIYKVNIDIDDVAISKKVAFERMM